MHKNVAELLVCIFNGLACTGAQNSRCCSICCYYLSDVVLCIQQRIINRLVLKAPLFSLPHCYYLTNVDLFATSSDMSLLIMGNKNTSGMGHSCTWHVQVQSKFICLYIDIRNLAFPQRCPIWADLSSLQKLICPFIYLFSFTIIIIKLFQAPPRPNLSLCISKIEVNFTQTAHPVSSNTSGEVSVQKSDILSLGVWKKSDLEHYRLPHFLSQQPADIMHYTKENQQIQSGQGQPHHSGGAWNQHLCN